jgi:tetratricopeptide (TPR) repeat protein
LLIEHAEALGETPEDPLLLFSVLYSVWVANVIAFNGEVARELAAQFLALGEQQGGTAPVMIGHRLMGATLWLLGHIVEGRAHLDRALALYDPIQHRPLATRFGQDVSVVALSNRSSALWLLGYPDAALADAERALKAAREIGHAATLLYVLSFIPTTYIMRGDYATAKALVDEGVGLASEKGAVFWKAQGTLNLGSISALTGETADAIEKLTSGVPESGQREQAGCRPLCRIWQEPMRNSANSMTLGGALTKRLQRWKHTWTDYGNPKSVAWRAKSPLSPPSPRRRSGSVFRACAFGSARTAS